MNNKRPLLIMFKGHPGTGKTTLAVDLKNKLSWTLISRDDIKEELTKKRIAQTKMGILSYKILWQKLESILKDGASILCDTNINQPEATDNINHLVTKTGCKVVIIECYCSDSKRHRIRLDSRKSENKSEFWIDSWEKYQKYLSGPDNQGNYKIPYPVLRIDTCKRIDFERLIKSIKEAAKN